MSVPAPELLSVVVPVFDEEAVLPQLRERLTRVLEGLGQPFEVILVDDGSTDRGPLLLQDWCEADARVKAIFLSRNFGHQAALTAGLEASRGDLTVMMDADLQDPPEVIAALVHKHREGFDVVYGRREKRQGESLFKRASAHLFYRLMRAFVHRDLPVDTGDFRLISRRALDAVLRMREVHRFLRGMTVWVGYRQASVGYVRAPRAAGKTKYSLARMLGFGWNAALSFSHLPLRVVSAGGAICATLGFGYGAYAVAAKVFWHNTVQGWTTVIVSIFFVGGAILLGLGVLGEYVARIYDEVKGRPLYLVRETRNVEAATPRSPSEAGAGSSGAPG
jgi:polyisoprenyl-phosphate glycosyltransferase